MNTMPFMELLERINPKVHRFAGYLASKSDHLEPGDCYQEAVLKVWARFLDEPDFLSYPDSYVTTFCAWMMKNLVNRERNMYTKRIDDLDTDNEEVHSYKAGYYPPPESEAVRSEVFSIAERMPQHYKTIFGATCEGYMLKELAIHFNVSLGAIKWRKRTMIEKMSVAYHTCSDERPRVIAEMHQLPSVQSDA